MTTSSINLMSRTEKAYSNSKYNIACANKLNITVQFYSPEFAKLATV